MKKFPSIIPVITIALLLGSGHKTTVLSFNSLNNGPPAFASDTDTRPVNNISAPIKDTKQSGSTFTFTLQKAATTSAGVFNGEGVLIRTLWSNVRYDEGAHTGTWNGKDDLGVKIPNGNYNVRVLSSNVQYTWDGIIGNTSDTFIGASTIHNIRTLHGMAFNGTTGYQAAGYSEGGPATLKFNTLRPQSNQVVPNLSIAVEFVVTDGKYVYWSANYPMAPTNTFVYVTNTANDSQVKLQKSTVYNKIATFTYNAVNYVDQKNSSITGLAVQKSGSLLVVSREGLNRIDVVNKLTGAVIKTIVGSFKAPRTLVFDKENNLWLLYTKNNVSTIEKFKIASNGAMTSLKTSILGLVAPEAFDISPDNLTITVADGGTSQQVKGFNTANGSPRWVLGKQGGYLKSPEITNDKFDFNGPYEKLPTFVAYQPDGSFWVEDPGNGRTQHFSSARNYINNITYRPTSYVAHINPGNPTQLFSDFLEYRLNYDKPLAGNNGSWTLVKNWAYSVPSEFRDQYYGFKPVTFLGHTYVLSYQRAKSPKCILVYELPASGPLRNTGIKITESDAKYMTKGNGMILSTIRLYPDGCLYNQSRVDIGKPAIWTKNKLNSIDRDGKPIWENLEILAKTPPVTSGDPVYQGNSNTSRPGEITTSGIVVSFASGVPPNTSDIYHLGGVRPSDGKWMWKTSMGTTRSYTGDFPTDGGYDNGNGVNYGGSVALAYDNSIFWGYYGEGWKGIETNIWNHYNDDGLMVGQFGVADPKLRNVPGVAGMAGNSFAATMVKGPDGNAYLYQNDESQHSGVHRWKIAGLETIQEQTILFNSPDIIPAKGSIPGNSAATAKVIDLMENLPRLTTLVDGRFGWRRYPASQILTDKYSNYWSVATSVKTSGMNTSPDVYVAYRQAVKSNVTTMGVTRDLENSGTVTSWRLQGNISYANSLPNGDKTRFGPEGEGGQFLDVLDDQSKVIARFSPRIIYDRSIISVVGNNAPLVTDTRTVLSPIISTLRPFYIQSTKEGKITFQYANYPPVTTDVYDRSSKWQKPKTLRLYFWTGSTEAKGNNSDRQLDLSNLTFSVTQ